MTVIDVDCHFEVGFDLEHHPLKKFIDKIPTKSAFLADNVAGDLMRQTPSESIPEKDLLAMFSPDPNQSSAEQVTDPQHGPVRFSPADPSERLGWFDKVGIDCALMNPGAYGFAVDFLGSDRPEGVRLANDFMADQVDGCSDRMMPVALIDWNDLSVAIGELERMRNRGSRAFWLRAEPYHGVSPAHPEWDRVWSAATDLGMVAILHVGNTPARFDGGWGNAGWELPDGAGLGGFFRFANCLRHQPAETMLSAMLYGGVFGRHPNLTVLTEELMIGWIPYFVARCEGLELAGPWPYELTPAEMIRRSFRATPLPGLGDRNISSVITALPEMLVFSSDFPHGEGSEDPIELYGETLAPFEPSLKESFFGGNIAECFARMGDPITVAARTKNKS